MCFYMVQSVFLQGVKCVSTWCKVCFYMVLSVFLHGVKCVSTRC